MPLLIKKKFYRNTAVSIYLCIDHSSIYATVVELVVATETAWPLLVEIFIIWLFIGKIYQPQIYRNIYFFVSVYCGSEHLGPPFG